MKTLFDTIRALRASSTRNNELNSAFNAMESAVWIIDNNHTILKSNTTAQKLFSLPDKEIIGKKCWVIAHGTDQPVDECPILRAQISLKRESMELQIADKWFEVIVDPILDSNGDVSRYIHIITEITERKRMEEQLKRSQRLLANAQKLAKTGGWEWDVGQQKMYWTKELYRLHGLDPSHFDPGSPEHINVSLECYKPEDRPVILDAFHRCADEGLTYDLEFEFTKSSGEKIWIRTAGEPIWKGDSVEKVAGNIIDITEFKIARDQLFVQSERINTFFNAIDDAIFIHPLQEQGFSPFVEVNQIACERYGYTYDEFKSLSAPDITIKPDVNGHALPNNRKELLEAGQMIFQTVHIKKSGEKFPVEINSNIFHQQNKPFILAVVRDISKRRAEEEKREFLIVELQDALENIKTLRGLLPICSSCKKIRDDKGYWNILESYIQKHSDASFSHGLCPECSDKIYGNEEWYQEMKKGKGTKA